MRSTSKLLATSLAWVAVPVMAQTPKADPLASAAAQAE